MLFLGILLWVNLVYSLRVALEGLFTHGLLRVADDQLLTQAGEILNHGELDPNSAAWGFLRRLVFCSLLELLALLLEVSLMAFMCWQGVQRPLALLILAKDAVYIVVMVRLARQQAELGQGVLTEFKHMPERTLWLERSGYLLSAAAMAWLLYSVVVKGTDVLA